jgi:starvation-inducible DNA-binding protein
VHSIGQIVHLKRVADNDSEYMRPAAMLSELLEDNRTLASQLRAAHKLCLDPARGRIHEEELLDDALEHTYPASDPISIQFDH